MASEYKEYRYGAMVPGFAHTFLLPHLERIIGSSPGTILDLGCGNGWIALELLKKGFDVYGVDASESGIRLADAAAPDRFHVLDLESGKLPAALFAKHFSTVISTEVIEHLYDPRKFLSFVRQILAGVPDGRLILSTPYHGYLKYVALAVSGKIDGHMTVLWDGGHIKFFSRRTLETMLKDQGFDVTQFSGAGRFPYLWKSMLLTARLTAR